MLVRYFLVVLRATNTSSAAIGTVILVQKSERKVLGNNMTLGQKSNRLR